MRRIAAIVLISAFAGLVLGSIASPPGLYLTQDIDERLQILETHKAQWYAERAGSVASNVLMMVGFGLLGYSLRAAVRDWVPTLGVAAFLIGGASALVFLYLQTSDPRSGYSGGFRSLENLVYWPKLAGMLLFGISFLRSDLPTWLGYLTVGTSLALSVVFLATGLGVLTPYILIFVELAVGIVLLRTDRRTQVADV